MTNQSTKRKRAGLGVVALVFLVVVGLWIASGFLVPWAASKYYGVEPCSQVQEGKKVAPAAECLERRKSAYGTFGDSFGAVNALFSGLALAGVVLTLFFHSEGAKRTAKPFIVPRLQRGNAEARVMIGVPTREGAQVSLPLTLSVPLQNASANPALNVDVKLVVQDVGAPATSVTEVPLSAGVSATCELSLKVTGAEANRFVGAVCGAGVVATLSVEYDSVEGVRWASLVKYILRVNQNRPEDVQMLRDAIDGAAGVNLWAAGATVDLSFELVSGSWTYKEV